MAMTRLGYLAIKKETTRAVAVKPTNFIRFKEGSISYDQEIIANNPIQNTRWNAITAVPGKIGTDGDFTIDSDVVDMGYFIYGALGTYAPTTLGSGAYKHTFNTANKLPSFTFEQTQGDVTSTTDFNTFRAFGVMVDSFELNGSDGIIGFKAGVKAHGVFMKSNLTATAAIGAPSTFTVVSTEGLVATDLIKVSETSGTLSVEDVTATTVNVDGVTLSATLVATKLLANAPKVELRPQTPSYSTAQNLFSFIHAKFQFADTIANALSATKENVENWTFSYNNQLEERYGSLRATPSVIAEKGASAMLKYTKFFVDRTDRDRYLDQTRRACVLTLLLNKNIGASTTPYKMVLSMSDCRFTGYKMDTGADDVYVAEMEAQLFYDSTDGKALQIELWNEKVDYTA